MAYIQINENSKIPKYMQIRSWLYGMIKRGKIKIGDRLPTEEELSKNFKVNRMTV
ncbi:MAG: GntR family transcriptional regulator, partial [Spirochaetales bacterium]|nr:GntR family transcriptional regulator [Spirochaetales bacterium]